MIQAVRANLVDRGLTVHEMELVDHLLQCHGSWKLEDHLKANLNGDNNSDGSHRAAGVAPLSQLMLKLGCAQPNELENVIQGLASIGQDDPPTA